MNFLYPGWIDVRWDNSRKNSYRFGKDNAMDVKVKENHEEVGVYNFDCYILMFRKRMHPSLI